MSIPFEPVSEAPEAFFCYESRETLLLNGKPVSPLAKAVLSGRDPERYECYVLSSKADAEGDSRRRLPKRLRLIDLVLSLRLWDHRWRDLVYVFRMVQATPRRHVPGRVKWLWAIRTYLVAYCFSQKCRDIACAHSTAYVMDYYSAAMLGIVMAFRRKGNSVWDIQHGTMGARHAAYNAGLFAVESDFRPTGLVAWDERFAGYAREVLGLATIVTNYGHLRLLSEIGSRQESAPVILYSLQPDTELPSQVLEAAERFRQAHWRFRLHPREVEGDGRWHSLTGLPHVSLSNGEVSLGEDLMGTDLHITFNSSVVHEAAALGVRSIVLDPSANFFDVEVASGQVILLNPGELIPYVSRWLSKGGRGS
jgi:hypothetical protein